MLQLKHPGVYTQELPSGVRPISGASTSVALFVGPTLSGIDNRKTRILSFGDFERAFGGLSQTSNLSYSVMHFFMNGGSEAFVIRVPSDGTSAASTVLMQGDADGGDSLRITALGSGVSSNEIYVEIDSLGLGAPIFDDTQMVKVFNLTVIDRVTGQTERFSNLSTSSSSARFAPEVVNDPASGSRFVSVEMLGMDAAVPAMTGTVLAMGALPAPSTFAEDQVVKLTVEAFAADGTIDTTPVFPQTDVTVFRKDAEVPTTKVAVVKALETALNTAIREDETNGPNFKGHAVSVSMFEDGAYVWVAVTSDGDGGAGQVDARVTLAAGPAGKDLLASFELEAKSSSAARYQLGYDYGDPTSTEDLVRGADGADHGQPASADFLAAVQALEEPDPFFNILCLPDVVRAKAGSSEEAHHSNILTIYSEAARICSDKFAFLLVDTPPDVTDTNTAEAWKTTTFTVQSDNAAAYFPKIRVDDPLVPGAIRAHPPSGAMAGLFARTDAEAGVWQAPAGTNSVLAGVYAPAIELSDREHGLLNPVAVNVIRKFPIFGTVSFGSRTLVGADAMAHDYKQVPVRRTADYILRSLSEGLRWAVHKPNGDVLWSQIRMDVTTFMDRMFKAGAFKGLTASEAYFVRCDASTTTQADIDLGIVNIVVGFSPLKPAEFVVISLQQMVQSNG